MNARALFSLLFHADKAIDLVQTALSLGVLSRLDAGPATLRDLARQTGAVPLRLYKFMDGLESLGLVAREPTEGDDLLDVRYTAREALEAAARAALGEASIERDRDKYPWRHIHGCLPEVLAGRRDTPFSWPPETPEEIRAFEASMAAGSPPIAEALRRASGVVFGAGGRWLDVGGGDGAVAAAVLPHVAGVSADVLELAAVGPLVRERAREAGLEGRLGFVEGDFLRDAPPRGYDVLSFVRVLHDWPPQIAREVLARAAGSLAPGGRVVVCEEFRTRDRLAVQLFWTYFLIGADACVSRLREVEWYTSALRDLGLTQVRVLPGPFDLVVAARS